MKGSTNSDVTRFDVAQYIPDDAEAAAAAFVTLEQLKTRGLVSLYLPAGWVAAPHRRFNVWLGYQVRPPHGERVTIEDWCAE